MSEAASTVVCTKSKGNIVAASPEQIGCALHSTPNAEAGESLELGSVLTLVTILVSLR